MGPDTGCQFAPPGYYLSPGHLEVFRNPVIGQRFKFGHMLRVFVQSRILNLVVPQSGNVYRVAAIRDRYACDPQQVPFDFHEVLAAIAPPVHAEQVSTEEGLRRLRQWLQEENPYS